MTEKILKRLTLKTETYGDGIKGDVLVEDDNGEFIRVEDLSSIDLAEVKREVIESYFSKITEGGERMIHCQHPESYLFLHLSKQICIKCLCEQTADFALKTLMERILK